MGGSGKKLLMRLAVVFAALVVLSIPRQALAEDTVVKIATDKDALPLRTMRFDEPQEAWKYMITTAAGKNKGFMTLGKSWNTQSELVVAESGAQEVTVDLAGYAIVRNTGGKRVRYGGVFRVRSGGRLVVQDSNPMSRSFGGLVGGVITGGASSNGGGAVTVEARGKFQLEGGTIYRCTTSEHGGAVLLKGEESPGYTTFDMKGGRIYFCQTIGAWSSCHGGAIYGSTAQVQLSNCAVDSCYSEDSGGGIYLNEGYLRLLGVKMVGNHCKDDGGALYVSAGRLYMKDCRVSTSDAGGAGGALYVSSGDETQISRCIFNKNKAKGKGGAIFVNDKSCYLVDTDVVANSAGGFGGGVYVDSYYDIGIKGLMRIYNNDGANGRNNLTLQDGVASRAYLYSGGLYEGSKVGLSSTGSNVPYAKGISESQSSYFFSDRGSLRLENTEKRATPFYSSVFADGGGGTLVLGCACAVVGGVAAYYVMAKTQRKGDAK